MKLHEIPGITVAMWREGSTVITVEPLSGDAYRELRELLPDVDSVKSPKQWDLASSYNGFWRFICVYDESRGWLHVRYSAIVGFLERHIDPGDEFISLGPPRPLLEIVIE